MATALQEVFARFGIEFDRDRALERGNAEVGSAIEQLRTLGRQVAGGFAFQWARDYVRETVAMGNAIDDTRQVLGISARELQEWQHVARLSGAEVGEFTASFVRLQDRMASGGAGAAVFRRLGVDIRNADGSLRNASDVLTDLADPIAAIGSDAERTGILVDLLGRSGARLGPLFARGSAGIGEVRAELEALGGGLSDEAIEATAALGDAWDRLDVVTLSLRSRLATLLLPALEWVSRGVATLTNNSRILDGLLVALGIASARLAVSTAATWGPMAIAAARVLLPLAVITLLAEDLIVLFTGGRSAIGEVMDLLGGDGTQESFVDAMNEGWERLTRNLREARDLWIELTQGLSETAVGGQTAGGTDNGMQRTAERGIAPGTGISLRSDIRSQELAATPFASAAEIDARVEARLTSLGITPAAARPAAPATVTNEIRIDRIEANGLDEAQAQRVVRDAVRDAMNAQSADTLDTLARGSVQ